MQPRFFAMLSVLVAACLVAAGHRGVAGSTVAGSPQAQSSGGTGVLVGRVTLGPMSPVGRSGDPESSAILPGVRVTVVGLDGREIASVITDRDGGYRVPLPPGSYRVVMPPLGSGRFTKDLPATVTISAGHETRVDIRVDSGIR